MIVSFIANLGADVKVKEVEGRKFLALYVCHDIFNKGEKTPLWVNVTCNYFEHLAQFLVKGRQVFICGELLPDRYTDRNGNERLDLKVRAYSVLLCGSHDTLNDDSFNDSNE